MATRRTFRTSRTGRRRQREWSRFNQNTGGLVGATNDSIAWDITEPFRIQGGDIHGATLMGLFLNFKILAVSTANDNAVTDALVMGVIVGDYDGDVNVPRPIDSEHADWMWYEWVYLNNVGTSPAASANINLANATERGARELHSRRRLDELQDKPWLVVQATSANPNTSFSVGVHTSAMLLLP